MTSPIKYIVAYRRNRQWVVEPEVGLAATLQQKDLPYALEVFGERGWDLVQVPGDLEGPWIFKQPV